ncbi:MAG: biotin/lipoyl-binding protein [Dysgonamonadaceae bacterium]|jgi:HlyD family secretion protein|nr:biotin/lipoyl-binding protein [Dysgonamonadaceae bacterium]
MATTTSKTVRKNNMLLAFILLIAALLLIAFAGWWLLKPKVEILQGQVEATELKVSGKVPGRILELRVKEGDSVRQGDTLVILDSPEITAKLEQAQAVAKAAQAQDTKADKGARKEQIATAYAMWKKAQTGTNIARKSYSRMQDLHNQGVISAQKRDEAEANYLAMKATEQAALSQYQMAKNGTQKEDKKAAQALVDQAQGAVDEVKAYLSETILLAPADGEVTEIFARPGELVGTGAPILQVLNKKDNWVVLNVREDLLQEMTVGKILYGYIPALNKEIPMTIFSLKDMGTYASWKATKTTGQYDLKTFEVKARPNQAEDGLYPGMSVIVKR